MVSLSGIDAGPAVGGVGVDDGVGVGSGSGGSSCR